MPHDHSHLPMLSAYRDGEKIDLSHPLIENMPVWPGHPRFCHDLLSSYEKGDVSRYHALNMGEHMGTHLDAPLHFVAPPAGWSIDETPIDQFVTRMVVQSYPGLGGGAITADMIRATEKSDQAPIGAGDSVFFHFGWDRKWYDDTEGFFKEWPGLDADAAACLAERKVFLVGSDCLSVDQSISTTFPAHRTLLGAGILIGENFNNLDKVGKIATLAAFPLPIVDGSGSPIRAVAVR